MPKAGVVHFLMMGILSIGIPALWLSVSGCGFGEVPARSTAAAGHAPAEDVSADRASADNRRRFDDGVPSAAGTKAPPRRESNERIALVAGVDFGGQEPHRFTIETHLLVEEDVLIPARMTGIVQKIFADRGSQVRKGQLLLSLRNHDLKLLVKRAEIALKQAEADYARAKRLHSERTISESDFEAIQLGREAVSVDLEIAREELERSMVRAPFSGLIIERFAKIGQKLIEEENPPLFRLTGLAPLHARLYLPERVARALREGDEVDIVPRFDTAGHVKGSVTWISPVIDASSGTSLAIVAIPSGGGESAVPLLPGAAVSVTLNMSPDGVP